MPKILITGANGQVGYEVQQVLSMYDMEVVACARAELDITNKETLAKQVALIGPDTVINCAAYTAVDKAETEKEAAFAANAKGVADLAEICRQCGVKLIHLSTDCVFDGLKETPYLETDDTGPDEKLSIYGASKRAGEEAIRAAMNEHIIIRPSWVYGVHGHNFIKTMLRLGITKGEVSVVNDQHGAPTAAADIAIAIGEIAAQISAGAPVEWGTYHYTGQGDITWYDFAAKIFTVLEVETGKAVRLRSTTTEAFGAPALRPQSSRLDCHKIERVFGIARQPWESRVEDVTKEILNLHGPELGLA
jgi:dTDP-4-dehydrorhamnose reductase